MRPGLLLHTCCAPCAAHVIVELNREFEVNAYFYNPNIQPQEEYGLRWEAMEKLAFQLKQPFLAESEVSLPQVDFELTAGKYDPERWLEAVNGLEDEPEGGARCEACYRFRLEEVARFAKEKGCDWLATTLTISPHKRAEMINPIGKEVAEQFGLRFYEADFKKKDGFKISCRLSRELDLYRQTYCGCVFSQRDNN
ncbi:MAG: epoxyqueuosine reductase QueH [bacterium]|nr:epoxyqueuosine reductase QueH [bacterium]